MVLPPRPGGHDAGALAGGASAAHSEVVKTRVGGLLPRAAPGLMPADRDELLLGDICRRR
jgi:hypothetical protein